VPNENTLLGLLTGGRYMQSSDLPTAREVGSSAIDSIIEAEKKRKSKVLFGAGKNVFGQPTAEFNQGDLEDLIFGFAGTTKPIMSALGLSRLVPRNPLYHITNIKNANKILREGIQPTRANLGNPLGKRRVSFTRDPNLKEVYGLGERQVQFLLDKDIIEKYAGKRVTPFAYDSKMPKLKNPFYEAEERLISEKLGAPLSSIRALKIRELDTPAMRQLKLHTSVMPKISQDPRIFAQQSKLAKSQREQLELLLKGAEKRNIPIITDKKYKGNIDELFDKAWFKGLRKGFFDRLKENVYYTGQ